VLLALFVAAGVAMVLRFKSDAAAVFVGAAAATGVIVVSNRSAIASAGAPRHRCPAERGNPAALVRAPRRPPARTAAAGNMISRPHVRRGPDADDDDSRGRRRTDDNRGRVRLEPQDHRHSGGDEQASSTRSPCHM